ncbi:MAG: cell surface protein SprA [Flavobacteriia bacterium]|nr:cell surface protein SprA [Flavobacteriia bacterium]
MKWLLAIVMLLPFYAFEQVSSDSLKFPIQNNLDPTQSRKQSFDFGDPSSVTQTIEYDPVTGTYVFKEKIGNNLDYRNPSMMTLEEYIEYERQKSLQDNWKEKVADQTDQKRGFSPSFKIPGRTFKEFFGSDEISIRPQGMVMIGLGVLHSRYDNPILPLKQRRLTRFDFQQQIQLNVVGQIGTKIKLNLSYNTQAAFDFDNITKLGYTGNEDQIIQKIELGNVSMPMKTTLIQGSQVLFGAYTKLRFGKLTIDGILASSKSKKQEITVSGKSQVQKFEITADNYEANKHYFLNLNFRDEYDNAMSEIPIPKSEINITRIEIWVTNRTNNIENTRNIIAFTDLGESKQVNIQGNPGQYTESKFPDNNGNGLYGWALNQSGLRNFSSSTAILMNQSVEPGPFTQAIHYEKLENARKLNESEYTYNSLLGFISLNTALNNDEVLAVAYEYTYRGNTYQVGEFSVDGVTGKDALFLKLLKPTLTNPKIKLWDLMMKNVYSIGAYQIDKQNFRLDLLYNNPDNSLLIPYVPQDAVKDKQIVTLLEMDRINMNEQPFPDGLFDFAPMTFNGARSESGGTINPKNGRIYFSTVEPFGKTLQKKLLDANIAPTVVNQIAYTELYDSTKTAAQLITAKNRFVMKGEYQSSISSDIALNALNIPEGAVRVTAGGMQLTEGVDYSVDYNLGRVKILNSGILESGTPLKISIESNSVFGFQAKSLVGTHLNYRFNENFNLGGTWMQMMERPVTQKVDYGTEPFKNNIVGIDVSYKTDLPFLTKLVDWLPVISTKAKSTLNFYGEFAHLIPGVPRAITKAGISYVDDFEASQSTIDLKQMSAWKMASTPQGQPILFPEGTKKDLSNRYNVSRLSWYQIDQAFYSKNDRRPGYFDGNPALTSDSRVRLVRQDEIWKNQQLPYVNIPTVQFLDLAYYPKERGMYNYDTTNVDSDGSFTNPENRWGGIMRSLTTNDFEQANIEYIQFWILDPFNADAENVNPNAKHNGGYLYVNLGNISEDILPDSRKSYENGMPTASGANQNLDSTAWAVVSNDQVVVNAFDTDPNSRPLQDIGLDGRNNAKERQAHANFVSWVNSSGLSQAAKDKLLNDPSSDDYRFYFDNTYDSGQSDILSRYKYYNGVEGNSKDTVNAGGYSMQASTFPDLEDLNNDNNVTEAENYFQYRIRLTPGDTIVGQNYVTSVVTYQVSPTKTERYIQYKIPVKEPSQVVNGISDFRSIRFMRMFLKDFDEEVVVRFAKLELVRGEWRRYAKSLESPGEAVITDPASTIFNIGALNFEENAERIPINYVLPPGIQRELDPTQIQTRQMNEQSMTLEVCGLKDGDARAAFKNATFDVRTYKKLKMFVHAEKLNNENPLNDDDLTLFVRLGTDQTENYYEYEMPLKVTPWYANGEYAVWPEANNVEIIFEQLTKLKEQRNKVTSDPNSSLTNATEYIIPHPDDPTRKLKIKGSPNLQGIRVIMIGVRNPNKSSNDTWQDDGMQKCALVWVNELRLTDFQNEGGSAALARLQIQAADFANFNLSGTYSGINWGSIDSKVADRQRNQQYTFDFNTNVALGQFFGRKAMVTLPFFYSYSIGIINPEYDPYNPDIKLADYEGEERKRRAAEGQDFTERKSYNFNGVRKEKSPTAKSMFYNISNFVANYSYSEVTHRDFNIKYDITRTWKGGLNYNYSFNSKPWEPFSKVKAFQKSKWFDLIKDFNINYLPKTIAVTNDIVRNYNEREVKNNLVPDYSFEPVFVKSFYWNRSYYLGWDFTKNLKFTFNAVNNSLFDENQGRINRKQDPDNYKVFQDTIMKQLRTLGQTTNYLHDYSLQYNIPINKIPVLDFMQANVKYSGNYNWQRAPLGQSRYGNIIQNSRVFNANLQMNFVQLYNKIPYFKKVLNADKGTAPKATTPTGGRKSATGEQKQPVAPAKVELKPPKPIDEMTKKELRQWERTVKKHERKQKKEQKLRELEQKPLNPVGGFFARTVMSIRNVSGTYAVTDGTLLPGFAQGTNLLGLNGNTANGLAGFIFGQQPYSLTGKSNGYNIAQIATDKDWLVRNSELNRQFTQTHAQNYQLKANLQPIKDLVIDLTMNRNYTSASSEFYRYNDLSSQFESQSKMQISTLTYSNISIGSAFGTFRKDNTSATFETLRDSRSEVSKILGNDNPNSSTVNSQGYAYGYGANQQDVVVGAFLAAYTDRKVTNRTVNPVSNIPLPNWNISYNGLSKMKFAQKLVKNFVLRHNYTSTVTVSGLQTNLKADQDQNGNSSMLDLNNNFYAPQVISNVTVIERFSPLIGMDATWKLLGQDLLTKFEYKKDKNANLALANNQVTEIRGEEFVFGIGYKIPKVKFPFKIGSKPIVEPLIIRFDFSLRDNITVIRKIEENTNNATAGQRIMSIKSTIDYTINQIITLQLYYDHTINTPKVAISYPTANMQCGIRLRINLAGI